MSASAFAIHWEKDWSVDPIIRPESCRHPGTASLTIGQRLETTKRGQSKIVLDADICMNCGVDKTGSFSLQMGLEHVHAEHGWDVRTAMRIRDLVHFHRSELWRTSERLSIWMAYAMGITGRWIVKHLNAAAEQAA